MTSSEISQTRILNQKIENSSFKTPNEIVSWMGAMQAQDFAMSKWAVGMRLIDSTEKSIEEAFNKGEILRTHVLRPTWHLVSPDDIFWMLDLTAEKIKSSMKSRNKELELNRDVFIKSNQLIEKALSKNEYLTREELALEYQKAQIRTDQNRLSHLLMEAELDQLICSGPLKDNKLTYALLQRRVPLKKLLKKDESLAELAKRYFSSRGPGSLKDFVWWSGLPVNEAKIGLKFANTEFNSETVNGEEYWFVDLSQKLENKVYLLPAFDEILIAYRDRSAIIEPETNKKAIFDNGVFRPILLINGKVSGIWKRTIKKEKLLIEIEAFIKLNLNTKKEIEKAASQYRSFYGNEVEFFSSK